MRRRSLTRDLMHTFLDLGDATSRNLGFSHRSDVWVSYGEETITETNLLEIRRRHPHHVRVRTFPKQIEATNGADWEWRIVGLKRTGPAAKIGNYILAGTGSPALSVVHEKRIVKS